MRTLAKKETSSVFPVFMNWRNGMRNWMKIDLAWEKTSCKGHTVDALVPTGDEGRAKLR